MLKLIYFGGCPNAERARKMLAEIGVPFEEVNQDDVPVADPLKGYASPTVLDGDKIIFGSKTGENSGGCSLDIPSLDQLKTLLGIEETRS